MIKECLPEAVVAADAPDAGVQVVVGEPHVVMFAPEGKTADRFENIAKLGHLGHSLRVEGRWGQFMFPSVDQLRNGLLVVTVLVGGDTPEGRTYLYYVSDDGGRNWRHYAAYDPATERPACDIVPEFPDPPGPSSEGPPPRPHTKTDGRHGILQPRRRPHLGTYGGCAPGPLVAVPAGPVQRARLTSWNSPTAPGWSPIATTDCIGPAADLSSSANRPTRAEPGLNQGPSGCRG